MCLAFANGANDNFKGVATLYGSGTTDYRRALAWATVTTFLGSIAAVWVARGLLKAFSGKGLVDDILLSKPEFAAAVALGAGLTVLLATQIGMPISTTHSLVGALVGAGAAAGSEISLARLGGGFFLPLLASPVLAIAVTSPVLPLLRRMRHSLGLTETTCLCVDTDAPVVLAAENAATMHASVPQISLTVTEDVDCQARFLEPALRLEAAGLLDQLHFLSAGVVSFARGLNDTPKIAALLLLLPSINGAAGTALVGTVVALGGILRSRRVADTMSCRITSMNHGEGFAGNLVTGAIVLGASHLGMPVSTTHVSCGALFGIGLANRHAQWRTIGSILLAWVTTLPAGACCGAVCFALLARF